jgi:membrane-associated phospholipid phosphatase
MADDGLRIDARSRSLTRRAVLGGSLAAGAMPVLDRWVARAAPVDAVPSPARWRPWLLSRSDELRPVPPAALSPAELSELLTLQGTRSAATSAAVARWDDPAVVLPWTQVALDLIRMHPTSPVRAARALALLHVAMVDALVATWDAREAFPREAPAITDTAVLPLGSTPASSWSFPSEHAAVAAAAAPVLAYLFPEESADGMSGLAEEAASSRLVAGRAFRSDIDVGQAIGRAVGERAIARGTADGSDAMWDGSGRLTGEGYWEPTPPGFFQQPIDPLAGSWQPWVLARGDQYRPPPPPPVRSPAWAAELAGVQEAVARRTPEQEETIRSWSGSPGTVTPAGLWIEIARDLIVRDGLDAPHAARVLALVSVAMADSFICCWDAKYTYWTERPITADPSLEALIPTPPFPSYTSGHATASTAAATVLGHLFPADAADLAAQAEQATTSRLWAGIHFPIDCEMGALGGGMIGRLVVVRAHEDGAEESRAGV